VPHACPQDWNEWGFFDYSRLHQNLASHHCDVAEFAPPVPFDAIYSISVLAHMTRAVREETLRRCRDWLRPGGCLLIALDAQDLHSGGFSERLDRSQMRLDGARILDK
jgi:predicted SAM-dependent methyltransferase